MSDKVFKNRELNKKGGGFFVVNFEAGVQGSRRLAQSSRARRLITCMLWLNLLPSERLARRPSSLSIFVAVAPLLAPRRYHCLATLRPHRQFAVASHRSSPITLVSVLSRHLLSASASWSQSLSHFIGPRLRTRPRRSNYASLRVRVTVAVVVSRPSRSSSILPSLLCFGRHPPSMTQLGVPRVASLIRCLPHPSPPSSLPPPSVASVVVASVVFRRCRPWCRRSCRRHSSFVGVDVGVCRWRRRWWCRGYESSE